MKPAPVPPYTAARKSSSLHKGVLCKTAAKAEEDEEMMIKFMSENPRFGNVQSEEKEYFSGSIVEGISEERVKVENGPCGLQKSSSYNEERLVFSFFICFFFFHLYNKIQMLAIFLFKSYLI